MHLCYFLILTVGTRQQPAVIHILLQNIVTFSFFFRTYYSLELILACVPASITCSLHCSKVSAVYFLAINTSAEFTQNTKSDVKGRSCIFAQDLYTMLYSLELFSTEMLFFLIKIEQEGGPNQDCNQSRGTVLKYPICHHGFTPFQVK